MRVRKIDGVVHHCCDWCRRDMTAEQAPHLTVELGSRSGIATPEGPLLGWRFALMLRPQQLHFCIPEEGRASCLDQWSRVVLDAQPVEYVL